MYLHRTLVISDRKTSIALERVFWDAIDRISNGNWRRWVLNAIEDKREDVGRAICIALRSTLIMFDR
jgi:predicted DNA-binding ribbon-helix-helix protein